MLTYFLTRSASAPPPSSVLFSKSHSQDLTVFFLDEENKQAQALGVDLEFKTTKLSPSSQRFFIQKNDYIPFKSPLIKWCIKEAAFKALSNLGAPVSKLLDVIVEEGHFHTKGWEDIKNQTAYKVIEDSHKILVFCAIFKQESSKLIVSKRW